jgi:hypothetical protein
VGPVVTYLDRWFGYKEDSVGATEWCEGPPCWRGLPGVTETVRIRDLGIGRMGFAVPWAVFVDEDWRFYLNGNYTAHCQPDERYCIGRSRVRRTGTSWGSPAARRGPGRTTAATLTHSCPSQYSTSGPAWTTPAQPADADRAYVRLASDVGEQIRVSAKGYTSVVL